MEVERVGPLSYDVVPPDRDPSAQRGIILGLLTAVAGWLVATVAGWFVLGFVSDARIVNRGFPLAIVVLALAVAFSATRRTMRRARRNGLLVVLGSALVAAFFATSTLANIKPTLPQVRAELDRVALPEGFRVVSETTSGDRLCRQGCPTVKRVYATPANDPDPVRTMVLAMFAQGWEPTSDVPPEQATTAQRETIFVHLGEKELRTVELTATRQS
ncbi:MAG TPA: hypothetical protein VNA20_13440 [Frankiaceae bacterium]|nr:hypothetical protein [Frankiaceae bacterium]